MAAVLIGPNTKTNKQNCSDKINYHKIYKREKKSEFFPYPRHEGISE
jgi:hypothetical protein